MPKKEIPPIEIDGIILSITAKERLIKPLQEPQ